MDWLLRETSRRPVLTYGGAVTLALAAFGLHHGFQAVLRGHFAFLFYFPSVVVASFLGGLGPGLLATACSLGLIALSGVPFAPVVGVPVFVLTGLLSSLLSELVRRAVQTSSELRLAREQLLAIVAHDLRNPLNAIILSARVLRQRSTPELERAITTIERSAARMENLIRDLVDATRLEHDRNLTIVAKEEDPRSIVAEAVEFLDPQSRAKSITLEASMSDDLPLVRCDRGRVLQVLGNLLSNALKFTPPGGQIMLRLATSGGLVRFEVADTGPGIAQADMPHLFERHWKGRASSGTGLGLFIAAGVIHAHGGRIWCHSEPGLGASFFFTLPVANQTRSVLGSEGQFRLT